MRYAEIGQKVRLAREETGLSQEELGKMLNCSGVTISSWETGKRRISLEDLHSLARLLGKPLAFFFPDESLSLNVEYQIGTLLQRSIGDFLGTKQIPVYSIQPAGGAAPHRVHLARHIAVATQTGADFGWIMPDDRLAAIGIGAGDIAVCRHCDGSPEQEDCLVIFLDGASFSVRAVVAGEEVTCPPRDRVSRSSRPGGAEAVCGILVLAIKHAEDILTNLKSASKKPWKNYKHAPSPFPHLTLP